MNSKEYRLFLLGILVNLFYNSVSFKYNNCKTKFENYQIKGYKLIFINTQKIKKNFKKF